MKKELKDLFRKIKLIVTDFDGVWTDGKVNVDQNGVESVICSRKDTLLIPEIRALGIGLFVISKEQNIVVAKRCEKMKIDYRHGVDDKLTLLKTLIAEKGLTSSDVAFVGDDVNDLPCLNHVGLPITVADGHLLCKAIAKYTTPRNGGDHAMRGVFEQFIDSHIK